MNLREIAKSLDLEPDEYFEILDLFVEKSVSDLDQLQTGLNEKDGPKVMDAAHSIKGASISIGLTEIYEIVKETEKEARENDLGAVSKRVPAIRERLEQIAQILGQGKREMR